MAAVDAALWDADPSDARISLDKSAATEKVWALVAVHIPCCLTHVLLTGVFSPHEAWRTVQYRSKK